MNIERTKYIIARRVDGAVMCSTMKKCEFVPPEMIDDRIVRLYRSADTALAAAEMAGCNRDEVRAEMVLEKIETI